MPVKMDAIIERISELWEEATAIWLSGGWAMVVLAIIALVMFALGMHMFLRLRAKGFQSISEKTWRRWIVAPSERKGPVGALLDYAASGTTFSDTRRYFEDLRSTEVVPFERDLRVMKICVSAAPLVGLLGTVIGMLATFGALASGSGGDKTMGLVAEGISEALITTETGLVVALPGVFFQYLLSRRCEKYKAFLAQLETVCTQALYKKPRRHEVAPAA